MYKRPFLYKHSVFLLGFDVIKVSFSKLVSCFCEMQ